MKRFFAILCCLCVVAMAAAQGASTNIPVGSWVGKLNVGAASLTLVFHIKQEAGIVKSTLDSPDQGAKGLGVDNEYLSADSVSLKMAQLGAMYRAKVCGNKMVGTFSQFGANYPLTLERGDYKPRRPQTPSAPYPYKTEEVKFVNSTDNATLAGTLVYPVGYKEGSRPPVVIMVSGSGLQNRDEEIFDHKPFLVIADYLARHGIASLRYDDRAFGASVGGNRIHAKATTLDYRRDAEAGVAYLRSLKKFGAVGVVGHSEGGNIAFMLGGAKVVDFVVSLAAVGTRVDVALTAQYNRIMELQGRPTKIDVVGYRQIALSSNNAWMSWFIDYDPTADIAATTCPTFALNGGRDCQVISSLNMPAIKRALPYNERSFVKEYPMLNHLFQHCTTGAPTEYNTVEETISAEVLNDMVRWINGVTGR